MYIHGVTKMISLQLFQHPLELERKTREAKVNRNLADSLRSMEIVLVDACFRVRVARHRVTLGCRQMSTPSITLRNSTKSTNITWSTTNTVNSKRDDQADDFPSLLDQSRLRGHTKQRRRGKARHRRQQHDPAKSQAQRNEGLRFA